MTTFFLRLAGLILFVLTLSLFYIGTADASLKSWCAAETRRLFADHKATAAKTCLAHEKYDASKRACVSHCGNEKACAQITRIEQAVAKQVLENDNYFIPANANFHEDTPISLSTYTVSQGKLGTRKDNTILKRLKPLQQNRKRHQEMWDDLVPLLPADILAEIKEFTIDTDGIDGYLGETSLINRKSGQLRLSLDPADVGDIRFTYIHELAHLLASSDRERRIEAAFSTCSASILPENTSLRDSYLNLFARRFWVPMGEKYLKLWNGELANESEPLIADLRRRFADRFVSDYALFSPVEDFAESFAYFVLTDKPLSSNKSIAIAKIRFFYEYPELVRLRDSLRRNLMTMR